MLFDTALALSMHRTFPATVSVVGDLVEAGIVGGSFLFYLRRQKLNKKDFTNIKAVSNKFSKCKMTLKNRFVKLDCKKVQLDIVVDEYVYCKDRGTSEELFITWSDLTPQVRDKLCVLLENYCELSDSCVEAFMQNFPSSS